MNYMKQVAEMLGVEIGEEFEIKQIPRVIFKLSEGGLLWEKRSKDVKAPDQHYTLKAILAGDYDMVKQPWNPSKGETYWTYNFNRFDVVKVCWSDWAQEFALRKCGAVFRTAEEALTARQRIYEELTGKKWSDT